MLAYYEKIENKKQRGVVKRKFRATKDCNDRPYPEKTSFHLIPCSVLRQVLSVAVIVFGSVRSNLPLSRYMATLSLVLCSGCTFILHI